MMGKNDKNRYLFNDLESMLDPKQPLYLLANKINWDEITEWFKDYYSKTGRPSKNIRLMVSLLIMKRIFNLGDETIIESWLQNPYMQYFSGEKTFQWKMPCDPSDLVHFRKRIGKSGVEKIFKISIEIHGNAKEEKEISVDTTVQEKNITFPTDVKLYKKICQYCVEISRKENIKLRQSYTRTVKKLIFLQRGKRTKNGKKKANKAKRYLKTIAGRLIRELYRKLDKNQLKKYSELLNLFESILKQERDSKNKIYSIHEPHIYCISKGKEHKKYEYGTKVSISYTNKTGIIVGALNINENKHDSKTLPDVIDQIEILTGKSPVKVGTDQGYRGISKYKNTEIIHADKLKRKTLNKYERRKIKLLLRRRAGIEAIIGHLKNKHRLNVNYLSGTYGDEINVMLAAIGFNFKKWLRKIKIVLFYLIKLFKKDNIFKFYY
jgi:transposase, IS5 family